MKKAFSVFDKGIEWTEILVSVISLIIITILVFLQVVLRYVFSTWLTFCCSSWACSWTVVQVFSCSPLSCSQSRSRLVLTLSISALSWY